MTNKTIFVCAGIIEDENTGKTLIAQRKSDSKLEPNKWEFPGGKIEFKEEPKDCLKREIKEELNLEISVEDLLDVYSHIYNKDGLEYHIVLITYLCKYISGEIKTIDCQDYSWINLEEFSKYNYADADVQIIEDYLEYKKFEEDYY